MVGMTPRSLRVSAFWLALVMLWLGCLTLFVATTVASVSPDALPTAAALALFGLTSSLIWVSGARHAGLWLASQRARAGGNSAHAAPSTSVGAGARVALLYCTADDFNAPALAQSMRQDRPVSTLILDDSTTATGRAEVDEFAAQHDVLVVRRELRTGYKAGNLNHAIADLHSAADFVVILDSDEVIPADFVSRALGHLQDPRVGIVQARHIARAGTTAFSQTFSGMLGTHIASTQPGRTLIGMSNFMGRGAMVRLAAYRAAGGIPELVCEDVAFSIAMRRAGYRIVYAHDLVSEEDYPVDYGAFRTQHLKTTQGAIELLMTSRRDLVGRGLRMGEKLDIVFELAVIPVTALAGVMLAVASLALAALGSVSLIPLWVAVITAVLAAVPLLPETTRLLVAEGPVASVRFFLVASALYSSTLLATVWTATAVLLGRRAVFRVTPKRQARPRPAAALGRLVPEVVVAAGFAVLALTSTGTAAPALTVLGSVGAHLFFTGAGAMRGRPMRTGSRSPELQVS